MRGSAVSAAITSVVWMNRRRITFSDDTKLGNRILTASLIPAIAVHAIAKFIAGVRDPKRFRDLETSANAIS